MDITLPVISISYIIIMCESRVCEGLVRRNSTRIWRISADNIGFGGDSREDMEKSAKNDRQHPRFLVD